MKEGDRDLSEREIKRTAVMYRTLMLLTPHPSLEETKKFYSGIADRLKVKVGDEEFVPVHGPVAENVAAAFRFIRRANPEEKKEVIGKAVSILEPLLYVAPHLEKKILSVLSKPYGKSIPQHEHEAFLKHLEKTQIRRPMEV